MTGSELDGKFNTYHFNNFRVVPIESSKHVIWSRVSPGAADRSAQLLISTCFDQILKSTDRGRESWLWLCLPDLSSVDLQLAEEAVDGTIEIKYLFTIKITHIQLSMTIGHKHEGANWQDVLFDDLQNGKVVWIREDGKRQRQGTKKPLFKDLFPPVSIQTWEISHILMKRITSVVSLVNTCLDSTAYQMNRCYDNLLW